MTTSRARTRVNAALAALRTGLAGFGPGGALLFANPRFGELFGLVPPHPPAGARFSTLLDQMATREEFAESEGARFIAAQREADRSCPSTARRIRADGQVIDIVSDPLPDGGWALTVTDISALARAEDEARRRATLLHSILEAFPHGVCVYGADRRVTMFNRAYTQVMTGAPLSIGDHLEDVIRRRAAAGEYGPGAADEIFAQQMAFDVTRPQMRKRRRPNGMTLDVRTTPLPDGGYISVVTDITPLTEAEAQVSRRADELAFMLSNIRHGVDALGSARPPGRQQRGCGRAAGAAARTADAWTNAGTNSSRPCSCVAISATATRPRLAFARCGRSIVRVPWFVSRSAGPAACWTSAPTPRRMAAGSAASPT